jgi:hypothetical protein
MDLGSSEQHGPVATDDELTSVTSSTTQFATSDRDAPVATLSAHRLTAR